MNQAQLRAPQEYSKAALSLAPAAGNGNGPLNGAAVDRTGYFSAIASHVFAFSGAPTGGNVSAQLQDSADGVTFANYGAPVSAAYSAGFVSLPMDLTGARQFIRAVVTAAPTGGTTPIATVGGSIRLYGPDRLPAL